MLSKHPFRRAETFGWVAGDLTATKKAASRWGVVTFAVLPPDVSTAVK